MILPATKKETTKDRVEIRDQNDNYFSIRISKGQGRSYFITSSWSLPTWNYYTCRDLNSDTGLFPSWYTNKPGCSVQDSQHPPSSGPFSVPGGVVRSVVPVVHFLYFRSSPLLLQNLCHLPNHNGLMNSAHPAHSSFLCLYFYLSHSIRIGIFRKLRYGSVKRK